MGEIFSNIKSNVSAFFQKYSKKQKITMGIIAFLVIAITTGTILYVSRPQYEILYKDLPLKESAQIAKNLEELKIAYKTGEDGTILVEKESLDKAKMELSLKGVPSAKFSYEDILNKNNMFMSEDEKQNAYNYALQNQVSTIIEQIPEVQKAYVTLSIPKDSDFILEENKKTAKASVFLDLKNEAVLDKKSVDGIATLVANSVEGLESKNVTIHDSKGKILNQNGDSQSFESSSQLELQNKAKEDIEKSLLEFLNSVYGYGNVSVMASVKLNFDTDITESKEFKTPVEGEDNGLIRSLQEENENVKENTATGVPGVDTNATNVPQYQQPDENNSAYDKNNRIVNYELNEVVKKVEKAKGQIEDITVAIILNTEALEGKELTDDTKKEIAKLVSAASGIDTKAVEVYAQSFNNDISNALKQATDNKAMDSKSIWAIILLCVVILIPLIGLIVYLIIRKRKQNKLEEESQADLFESHKENIEEIELDIKESGHKKSIEALVQKNPELVSQLLKSWLNEE